jgi:hypothetical protein
MAAKADRKSNKPVLFRRACELVAKRLDVDDIDYAERRLCEELARPMIKFGRDWFASQVEPTGADITELWRYFGYDLVVDRNMNKATFKRVVAAGVDWAIEDVTAYNIKIAPAVIDALVPVARRGKSTGRPRIFKHAYLQGIARKVLKECGAVLESFEGEGGLIDQVRARVAKPSDMPESSSQAREILLPVWNEFKNPR